MEGVSELAGNLKAELLAVRHGLHRHELTEEQAYRRLRTIRRRRIAALEEAQREAEVVDHHQEAVAA